MIMFKKRPTPPHEHPLQKIAAHVAGQGAALVVHVDEIGRVSASLSSPNSLSGDLCTDKLLEGLLRVRSQMQAVADERKAARKAAPSPSSDACNHLSNLFATLARGAK